MFTNCCRPSSARSAAQRYQLSLTRIKYYMVKLKYRNHSNCNRPQIEQFSFANIFCFICNIFYSIWNTFQTQKYLLHFEHFMFMFPPRQQKQISNLAKYCLYLTIVLADLIIMFETSLIFKTQWVTKKHI